MVSNLLQISFHSFPKHLMIIVYMVIFVTIMIIFLRDNSTDEISKKFNHPSPLYQSFDSHFAEIFTAIVATVAINVPILLELLLDINLKWKCGISDLQERIQMMLAVVIPMLIVLVFDKAYRPYIFCCAHVIQYVGCFDALLSLNHKLIPKYFTKRKTFLLQLLVKLSEFFCNFINPSITCRLFRPTIRHYEIINFDYFKFNFNTVYEILIFKIYLYVYKLHKKAVNKRNNLCNVYLIYLYHSHCNFLKSLPYP